MMLPAPLVALVALSLPLAASAGATISCMRALRSSSPSSSASQLKT